MTQCCLSACRVRSLRCHNLHSGPPQARETATGLAIGIPVAIFSVHHVKSQPNEVTRVNLPVMVIALGELAHAGAIAGMIPARSAASIDPVRALRMD
jgi:macrolide transport system ATP-binding/permease protein